MVTYICLMRGINVGGNNLIDMKTLKAVFEALGFTNVRTYINSGNVLFQSESRDWKELTDICKDAINSALTLDIDMMVLPADELSEAMAAAPDWWGDNPEDKHNAIFVMPPATCEEIMEGIGEIKPQYEKVACAGPIIFWSASLANFSRTRWSQLVKTKYYKNVTIRNSNTARKLLELSKK